MHDEENHIPFSGFVLYTVLPDFSLFTLTSFRKVSSGVAGGERRMREKEGERGTVGGGKFF